MFIEGQPPTTKSLSILHFFTNNSFDKTFAIPITFCKSQLLTINIKSEKNVDHGTRQWHCQLHQREGSTRLLQLLV